MQGEESWSLRRASGLIGVLLTESWHHVLHTEVGVGVDIFSVSPCVLASQTQRQRQGNLGNKQLRCRSGRFQRRTSRQPSRVLSKAGLGVWVTFPWKSLDVRVALKAPRENMLAARKHSTGTQSQCESDPGIGWSQPRDHHSDNAVIFEPGRHHSTAGLCHAGTRRRTMLI